MHNAFCNRLKIDFDNIDNILIILILVKCLKHLKDQFSSIYKSINNVIQYSKTIDIYRICDINSFHSIRHFSNPTLRAIRHFIKELRCFHCLIFYSCYRIELINWDIIGIFN